MPGPATRGFCDAFADEDLHESEVVLGHARRLGAFRDLTAQAPVHEACEPDFRFRTLCWHKVYFLNERVLGRVRLSFSSLRLNRPWIMLSANSYRLSAMPTLRAAREISVLNVFSTNPPRYTLLAARRFGTRGACH